ncbi:hypothetical protein BRADI_2g06306v3 [Brachypodium distachyon]|uniref:F-box domain-containing protein n=1 Tax=Brachypodium distachyon TaxID=15368 RepID=A0A0Q3FUU8_BRADI|nr:hypothetical protein BRADI_2g06306v3 [Brachypodium distachyon]
MAENGGAPIAYLCSDMIYEILLRVPAVYIHRSCRNVCQAWRALLGEGPFIAAYGRRRSPMPLYFYHESGVLYDGYHGEPDDLLYSDDLHAVDLAARHNHRVLGFADTAVDFWHSDLDDDEPVAFRIRGSCDGILFLTDLQLGRLYACNPCTRHWARLPECPFVAFYAHGPAGDGREYRVLQAHPWEGEGGHPSTIYSIRVLGAPEEQAVRLIGHPTSPAMSAESALAIDDVLSRGIGAHLQGPPVMLHGTLHWLPTYNASDRHGYKLLTFNTVAEDFRWVSSPPALTDPDAIVDTDEVYGIIAFQLLEIDGKLAMAIMDVRPGTMVNGNDAIQPSFVFQGEIFQ